VTAASAAASQTVNVSHKRSVIGETKNVKFSAISYQLSAISKRLLTEN
jgi:hypothetical protein